MLTRFPLFFALAALPLPFVVGCGSNNPAAPDGDAGTAEGGNAEGGGGDAGADGAAPPSSNIKHVVIIIQENHTFDSYFGTYCTAPTGSNPTCTAGPACCEAAPATLPNDGGAPTVLNDTENTARDPDHTQATELTEMNGGAMDRYLPRNVAYADPAIVAPYRAYAGMYALADRYFQPVVGQSSSNDMYFARAKFVFLDNTATPDGVSARCNNGATPTTYTDNTIADFLNAGGVSWGFYAEGYQAAVAANPGGGCPTPPADCPLGIASYPCIYDPGDDPFAYYPATRDNAAYMHDYGQLATDLAGTLPAVSYVKAIGYKTEHPRSPISPGVSFVTATVSAIQASKYAADTLVILTYDEGGGYFDHVTPPATSPIDMQPYGTRVPFIAIGKFAKANFVSHLTMEHSSVVKFIEWNFLGKKTGQLGNRDTTVNNLGSLLDPSQTGTAVPE